MPESDYREELQLLFDAAESFTEPALGHHRAWQAAMNRARALLDQPEPEGVTDDELMDMAEFYIEDNGLLGLHNAGEFARVAIAADRARRPTPQPPVDGEVTELVGRLKELAHAVTKENWREFDMRVPAEPLRDADLVLTRAAELLQRLAE